MSLSIRQLTPDDAALMEALLATFGKASNEVDTYSGNRPNAAYLQRLLGSDYFIVLAALRDGSGFSDTEIIDSLASNQEERDDEQEKTTPEADGEV